MENRTAVSRHGGACQNKLPRFLPVIYFETYRIPKLRSHLPLINKARCFSFQQDIRLNSCQFLIHLPILRRRHINHTFGGLLSRRRFAAKFRAFDQYRADPLQFAFQKVVNNPVLVSCCHFFCFSIDFEIYFIQFLESDKFCFLI